MVKPPSTMTGDTTSRHPEYQILRCQRWTDPHPFLPSSVGQRPQRKSGESHRADDDISYVHMHDLVAREILKSPGRHERCPTLLVALSESHGAGSPELTQQHALAVERRTEPILSTQQQASSCGGDHFGSIPARIISPELSPEYRGLSFGRVRSRSRLALPPVRLRRQVECGATIHLDHQQRRQHSKPRTRETFWENILMRKRRLWIPLIESISPKKTAASFHVSEPVPVRTSPD